ncbi:hypothetical protein [Burkholderia ambifaria]|uniref:hypothetical protein n=1 Tax=Burkholderia ambifaria TaxID=152480 RepID=UPI003132B3D6
MAFLFARMGTALAMRVEDVYVQDRRPWVRGSEKGGKVHAIPCHHALEAYLHAYLEETGIAAEPKGPLFRTIVRGTGQLRTTLLPQANAYTIVRGRALAAGNTRKIGKPHLPRDRHHILSRKRRHAGERRGNGQPTRRRARCSFTTRAAATSAWTR